MKNIESFIRNRVNVLLNQRGQCDPKDLNEIVYIDGQIRALDDVAVAITNENNMLTFPEQQEIMREYLTTRRHRVIL